MGLDMYVVRKKKDLEKPTWENTEEIAYWRKANQVHKWFVDNIQKGVDDCGYYKVEKEDLQKLVDICNDILRNTKLVDGRVLQRDYSTSKDGVIERIKEYGIGKIVDNQDYCKEKLPTQEGFFFGSYEYDEWYIDDIKYTVQRLQAIIDLLEWDLYDVYYGSSW